MSEPAPSTFNPFKRNIPEGTAIRLTLCAAALLGAFTYSLYDGVRRGSEKLLRKNRNLTQVDVGKQIDLILKKGEFPDQEEYVQRFKEASKVMKPIRRDHQIAIDRPILERLPRWFWTRRDYVFLTDGLDWAVLSSIPIQFYAWRRGRYSNVWDMLNAVSPVIFATMVGNWVVGISRDLAIKKDAERAAAGQPATFNPYHILWMTALGISLYIPSYTIGAAFFTAAKDLFLAFIAVFRAKNEKEKEKEAAKSEPTPAAAASANSTAKEA